MSSHEYSEAGATAPGQLAGRREALGLTQAELAKLLGVDLAAIVQWERFGDAPRQLPASVPDFTGRQAELAALTRVLDEANGSTFPGALVISAIGGTAGVGKTALALHWAHRVAHRFPDGQLHVNLRGFDPSGAPMPPADAIRGFLDSLGVPPERIPRSTEAQAGLYRSLLADKRMLIVLDNARDEEQVRPLLPASPGSLVLVTSRSQIAGLAAAEGARIIFLDALAHREAVQLLTSRLGSDRAGTDWAALSEIATLCACLPLALSVAAARIAAHPALSLSGLAAELRDTAARLDALDVGDPRASVQAVFSWSYQQLSPQAARMFRLLGLHPGPDISVAAAACLAGTSQAEARRLLHELAHGCLINEHAPGRYAFHDLLRAYAARQASALDDEPERTAAVGRVLDHYAQSACAAAILLYPSRELITFAASHPRDGEAGDGQSPRDAEEAQAWLEAELPNLTAAVALAADSGFDRQAWQLPWFLATHLARRGYSNERITLLRTALTVVERLEDNAGQAMSHRLLANAYLDLRDHARALEHYQASAELYKELGDRLGESKAVHGVAMVTSRQRRHAEAIGHLEYVLQLQQELGHKSSEAKTLITLGGARGALGAISDARDLCRRALTLATELGNPYLEMSAWHGVAYAHQVLGEFTEAAEAFRQALDRARTVGDRLHQADLFAHLGDLHHAHGKPDGARDAWSRALAIFQEIHHPDADHVRAKLANPGLPGSSLPTDSLSAPDLSVTGEPSMLPWCSLVRYSQDIKQPTDDTIELRRIDR